MSNANALGVPCNFALSDNKISIRAKVSKWHKEKGGSFVIHKALIAAHSGGYGQNEQRSEARK